MKLSMFTLSRGAAGAVLCGSAVFVGCEAPDDDVAVVDEYGQNEIDYDTQARDVVPPLDPAMPDQEPADVTPQQDAAMNDAAQEQETAQQVEVGLDEFAINMPQELRPGEYEFHVTNNGSTEHSFEIEGPGLDERLTAQLDPGETERIRVSLLQGDYTVYCPVGEHEEHGMEMQLSVTPNAEPVRRAAADTTRTRPQQ